METRKVTIINSKTQSQKVIQDSKATTLGELKQEMRERGIDYTGMTFFEGHMRAELKDDAAPLPTNIPYKGQVVNDLTFMLTAPEKKVKSGAMSRAEAYTEIKKKGLQGACVSKFGKNFTQCSTADLISLIEKNSTKAAPAPKAEKPAEAAAPAAPAKKEEASIAPETPATGCNCSKAIAILAEALYDNDTIEEETYDAIMATLKGGSYSAPEKMSKKEIDTMFDFVER
nr:MAG TPA: hypothetical protein [Crassvirales sp.]